MRGNTVNRRHFIKNISLISAGLSTGAFPVFSHATPFDERIEKHHALLNTVASALLPTEGYPVTALKEVPVAQNVKTIISNLDDHMIEDLSLALSLFNNASYVMGFNFKPFEKLSVADAQAYIRSWENGFHMQKVIAITLKKLVYMGYWGDDRSWVSVPSFERISNQSFPSLGVSEFKG